jgi:CheY-like chemotaxis protein
MMAKEGRSQGIRFNHASTIKRRLQPRVLIVEDDGLAAAALQVSLEDAGYLPLAPAASVATALECLKRNSVDAALLDINLGGELVYPVADALASRGVPFVFVSGCARADIPPEHRDRPLVAKPFQDAELLGGLAGVLAPT